MTRRKIYVASSWRNEYYPEVVAKLFDGVCCSIEEVIEALNG